MTSDIINTRTQSPTEVADLRARVLAHRVRAGALPVPSTNAGRDRREFAALQGTRDRFETAALQGTRDRREFAALGRDRFERR